MRIISGKYKGHIINCPRGKDVRPTTDRVKESIFSSLISILGSFDNAIVLDAFAGSGSLGFEALSRGAKSVVMFENNYNTYKNLINNASKLNLNEDELKICKDDVFNSGFSLIRFREPFNVVFLDPPYKYNANQVLSLLTNLIDSSVLKKDCDIVYEHSSKDLFEKYINSFQEKNICQVNDKIYGEVAVTYLKYKGSLDE